MHRCVSLLLTWTDAIRFLQTALLSCYTRSFHYLHSSSLSTFFSGGLALFSTLANSFFPLNSLSVSLVSFMSDNHFFHLCSLSFSLTLPALSLYTPLTFHSFYLLPITPLSLSSLVSPSRSSLPLARLTLSLVSPSRSAPTSLPLSLGSHSSLYRFFHTFLFFTGLPQVGIERTNHHKAARRCVAR